jgi:hypothetical protein
MTLRRFGGLQNHFFNINSIGEGGESVNAGEFVAALRFGSGVGQLRVSALIAWVLSYDLESHKAVEEGRVVYAWMRKN